MSSKATTKPTCPACGSPDTVSYWDLKENCDVEADGPMFSKMLRDIYPHARKCVDCGFLDHDATRQWRLDLSKLTKATFKC